MSNSWKYFVKCKKDEVRNNINSTALISENPTNTVIMKKMAEMWGSMTTEEKNFFIPENIPENYNKRWTKEDDIILLNNMDNGIETEQISIIFKRTVGSIRCRLLLLAINILIEDHYDHTGISECHLLPQHELLENVSNRFKISKSTLLEELQKYKERKIQSTSVSWKYFVKCKKDEVRNNIKITENQNPNNNMIMKKMGEIWKSMTIEEKKFFTPENNNDSLESCLKDGSWCNKLNGPMGGDPPTNGESPVPLKKTTSQQLILNTKQRIAFDIMCRGENLFLTGSGGVGKTRLIQHFISINKNKKNKFTSLGITSTTGTSAIIFGGSTLHSFLGIGLGNGDIETLYRNILSKKYIFKRWINLKILIIDEVSMLNPDLFDKLEILAKRIKNNDLPFGGIQLILSGDFLQLPVVGSDNFCFEALSWNSCITNIINLTEIIRQSDEVFQRCLNNIRFGNITEETIEILNSRVGVQLCNDIGIKPTRLYPLNKNVDYMNEKEISKINDDFYEYDMTINNIGEIPDYTIEKYVKNCQASETIQLAVGVQVMLLYNLDFEKELVNGSRGVIIRFVNDIPVVKFLNGVETLIDFHDWDIKEQDKIVLTISQIPLKLAYSFTIHKLQGSSLDYVEVDLSNIFTYAQAYVSLSRVRSLEGLSIIAIDYTKIKAHPKALEFYNNLI